MKNTQQKLIPEVLDELSKDPKNVAAYQQDFAFKTLLKCAFDTEYKFVLPEGDPPFKPTAQPLGMSPASLRHEMRRMYVFTKFGGNVTRMRREQMYVQLLESVHPSEAKIINAMKDQKLDALYPKINAEFVKKNFPDVLPEGTVVAEPAKKSKAKSAPKVG
jgi:hypothetical protein